MFTSKINKKSTIVTAKQFIVGAGYKQMLELAEVYGGKVETVKINGESRAKITFGEVEHPSLANQFMKDFEFAYEIAHINYAKAHKKDTTTKTPSKKTSSSKKTTKAKGNKKITLNDFIVNNPSCTREEAKAYGFKGTRADLRAKKVELGVR